MRIKRIISSLCAAAVGAVSLAIPTGASADNGMRNITTMELVRDMGIGINLGNTMEACGDWIKDVHDQWGSGELTVKEYETAWGSPEVTKEMIQGMANEGFGVCRVPVAWSNLMEQDGTYTINPKLTNRVKQIVDWVLDSGMYCIINIHWDNGWVNTFPENKTECMKRYETMWTQIAEAFKDYDDYLMFESQNEELGWESIWNPWSGNETQKKESYALANEINQKFVDVIRKSGGNNPERHLLISGYNTGFDRTCDPLFVMPNDPKNRCAVSVHYYTPAGFAILEDKDESWAKARSTWGTDDDYKELNQWMDMMKTNYVDKGIPVIVGEYGCPTKGKEAESVRKFLSSVCKAAYEDQLCPVLWSTPDSTDESTGVLYKGHYNRATYKLNDQLLKAEFDKIRGTSDPVKPRDTQTTTPSETIQPVTTQATTQPAAVVTTTVTTTGQAVTQPEDITPSVTGTIRDMSTAQIVRDMGLGINLGNTFESCGDWIADVHKQWGSGPLSVTQYETAWGSSVITEDMIKGYKSEGFGVLRVPVAWSNLMSTDGTYTIDSGYINRVKEVVNWAIKADMYVILNIHWDGGWWTGFADSTKKDECMKKYIRVWEQLTSAFGAYGDKLVFESLNEEGKWDDLWNQWSNAGDKNKAYSLLNEINQKFVDLVRASGGNNADRHLLIAGYGTDVDLTCDPLFKMPTDPKNRCAVSVHYYTPSTFCILEEDADWGKCQTSWGTEADLAQLKKYMDMLKTTFVDKGVPVIIGEYGATKKNKDPDSVRLFIESVAKEAYSRQMCPVLWDVAVDDGNGGNKTGLHYDRYTQKMVDSELKAALNAIVGASEPVVIPTEPTTTEPTTEATTPSATTAVATTEPVPTSEVTVTKYGDVDLNGVVELADVTKLSKFLLNKTLFPLDSEIAVKNADVTHNGVVDTLDLSKLLELNIGNITESELAA